MAEFKSLFNQNQKEYRIRIKTLFPVEEEYYDKIERVLRKYQLLDISPVRKTIFQQNPLDFKDVEGGEVFMIDAITAYPVSSFVLQKEIKAALAEPESLIRVRGEDDPLELETDRINHAQELDSQAEKDGLTPAPLLSTDPNYLPSESPVSGSLIAGNDYNEKFKGYLSTLAANRKPMEVPVEKVGLFNWLNDREKHPDAYEDDFNRDIKDAPKVHPSWSADDKISQERTAINSMSSNFSNFYTTATYSKAYKDSKGKTVELSVPNAEVQKTKGKTK